MFAALLLALFTGVKESMQSECLLRVANGTDYSVYRKLHWLKPNVSSQSNIVPDGGDVEVACETGFLQNQLISKAYTIRCTNGRFNGSLRFDDFLCRSRHQENTTIYRRPCCDQYFGLLKCIGKNMIAYEVGHLQPSGCGKHLYTACVDKLDLRTVFTYEPRVMSPLVRPPKVGCKKGIWGFNEFGQTVDEKKMLSKAYYQKYQKQKLTSFYPGRYGRKKPYPYYFNRGHITPSGDFPECEQAATYEYINLAPQWQVLNQGSWNSIEDEARDTVRNNTEKWVIYTGTFGKIPTPRGLMHLIQILEKGVVKKSYIPVPMLYWKIVYNTHERNQSAVYIGVNNPDFKSFEEITPRYFPCRPIRNNQNKFFIGSEFKGFVYQCQLDDFLRRLSVDEGIVT